MIQHKVVRKLSAKKYSRSISLPKWLFEVFGMDKQDTEALYLTFVYDTKNPDEIIIRQPTVRESRMHYEGITDLVAYEKEHKIGFEEFQQEQDDAFVLNQEFIGDSIQGLSRIPKKDYLTKPQRAIYDNLPDEAFIVKDISEGFCVATVYHAMTKLLKVGLIEELEGVLPARGRGRTTRQFKKVPQD